MHRLLVLLHGVRFLFMATAACVAVRGGLVAGLVAAAVLTAVAHFAITALERRVLDMIGADKLSAAVHVAEAMDAAVFGDAAEADDEPRPAKAPQPPTGAIWRITPEARASLHVRDLMNDPEYCRAFVAELAKAKGALQIVSDAVDESRDAPVDEAA